MSLVLPPVDGFPPEPPFPPPPCADVEVDSSLPPLPPLAEVDVDASRPPLPPVAVVLPPKTSSDPAEPPLPAGFWSLGPVLPQCKAVSAMAIGSSFDAASRLKGRCVSMGDTTGDTSYRIRQVPNFFDQRPKVAASPTV